MKNFKSKVVIILLFIAVGVLDILKNGNGFLQLFLAALSSIVVFYIPLLEFKLKKIPYIVLLFTNIAVFAVTYASYRVLLINMLFLSYLIWYKITPRLLHYKSFLPITFLISFISVYTASFLNFSVPLFLFVFYPIYVSGFITHLHNMVKTKKVWGFVIFNALLSGFALVVIIYKILEKSILGNILFLNFEKLGTVTAVYLPFIALLFAWFAVSVNLLLYLPVQKFVKSKASFELTAYTKPVYNFIMFLSVVSLSTFICELSIRQNLLSTLHDILEPNLLFNILLLASIYLFLISLIGKGISNIIIALLTIFLAIANYIKFTYFEEPFYPWDIYLIKNLIGISKNYLNIPILISVLISLAVIIFMVIRFRKAVGRYLKPRISLIFIPFAAILFLLNVNVLTHSSLSTQIGIQKSWYIGRSEILANGMLAQNYFYLDDLDKYLHPKPKDYSQDKILAVDKKYEMPESQAVSTGTSKTVEKPNVVVIMSESYWDLTKLSGIKFSKDIAENVHKYQKGELAPPAIGGGTANTEFEALTGMSMYFMSPGIITYNAYLRTETPSIATVFKNNGYSTTAIHPNSGWFYNRDKVYPYFGFDKFIDVTGFNMTTETKGPHISDDALVNKILNVLDSSEEPSFIFAVSMENHDPFNDKYSDGEFDVSIESDQLDESQKEIVKGYAQGIYDADQSLGKLIDALGKSDKPTLLYFFGDHAPRLGTLDDYYKIYDKLAVENKSETEQKLGELKYYTTPLVTWSNYTETRSFSKIISPSHISYEVLKDAGVKYPNYFNILTQLEAEYPVMHLKGTDLVNPDDELIQDYQLIQYDLLFGKKYLKDIKATN
ncbi:phosphoglycerol transferase MdoB-like AlkP superfamily enzyme [Ruminiclostridium sufflavum DSM 19573]|uniref:Phosphoglycerol transferase MdoB-like AlkP superfamily enzyme n=1 Tax=Ruminiclostridium sufflavum DSM 19573 TaxID=1121337 RepID=A0A318XJK7_9FIRM|nr:alkaline phosphatase family protein [Ruminiclostridium sufflavum]PYG87184.1 phosphoglycerol transferase MdoB-like AlkP superfamily enzyme [Ruminiclostridium sufflavum DSM 19573]